MEQLIRIRIRRSDELRAPEQYIDFADGTRAGLRARYSAMTDRWHLWILALDGEVIAYLGAAVPGYDMLLGHKHDPRVPQGELFIYSEDRAPPNRETIDVSAWVFYRPVDLV